MPPQSPRWFHVPRDLQSSGNGQNHCPLCWEPGKWTETAQWEEAEEAQAQAGERELAKTPRGMVAPRGGQLGLQRLPGAAACVCLNPSQEQDSLSP